MISDGVFPGNKDQSYFVRRLIRRAVRTALKIDIGTAFAAEVSQSFIESYKSEYKNLEKNKLIILTEISKEEEKFRTTLDKGQAILIRAINIAIKTQELSLKGVKISGAQAFDLLQSYGFPIELTEEIGKEHGVWVDRVEFDKLKEAHAESSRTASAGKFKGGLGGDGEMEVKFHTATHLLHQALRTVLGEHVFQKGSNITPERLRFDFSHDTKMTDEEKKKVEDLINSKIAADLPVTREEVSFEEAKLRGAIGLFEDKYSDVVSIYRIGEGTKRGDSNLYSIEFCGGPHVEHLGVLGTFKIQKEEAVSAGVRRIKAILE